MITSRARMFLRSILFAGAPVVLLSLLTGCALFTGSNRSGVPAVSIAANPSTVPFGTASTLIVTAINATQVTVTGTDGTTYNLPLAGGTQAVSPKVTTTYTAVVTAKSGATASASATVTVPVQPAPTVTISANPSTINAESSSTLTVAATLATQVTVTGSDGSSYTLATAGGTQSVAPKATTTYTATATGAGGSVSATATVTVTPASLQSINHVVFLLQENHTFDNYFGMLNPYRKANSLNIGDDGVDYEVDGIDDKLATITNKNDEGTSFQLFKFKSTCIEDESSDWLASYKDVSSYDFTTTRPIRMDGFVLDAEGYAKFCSTSGTCSGSFPDLTGKIAMGYYDQDFLNYYYYMASQFAISDRWFSPVSSKSVDNRIAMFTGGTTEGIVKDPGNDHLPPLDIPTIFQELDQAKVTWKIYYIATQGLCAAGQTCSGSPTASYPATDFANLAYAKQFFQGNPGGAACPAPLQQSSVVGDSSNSFCIDPTHITPISSYFSDLNNGTLPSFAFIEAGYGFNDEHPGSGQSILVGQTQVAAIINALMSSSSWKDSVFFLGYDEGGGPYDHVPPVPAHSNDFTDTTLGAIPDISAIGVNADSYGPCVPPGGTPTLHCDLVSTDPGAHPNDAPAVQGFAAQLGFRIPNFIVSPFVRKHYVSHTPMDHTAVIKFVENRFIGSSAHLTARDAAQPDLLEFFDFNNIPWETPPSPPAPVTAQTLGSDPCTPASVGP
jgi:phospholipase C